MYYGRNNFKCGINMWTLVWHWTCILVCHGFVSSIYQNDSGNGHGRLIVNCSGRGLNLIPENIDKTTEELYLRDNNISRLPSKVFQRLRELRVLDLSFNKIEFVDETAFYGLYKLSVLSLENNNITQSSLQHGCFTYLQSLHTLTIRSNPYWTYHMDKDRYISLIQSLQSLNVDFVDKIKFSKQIGKLRNLKKLSISINNAHYYTSLNWYFTIYNDTFHPFTDSSVEEISLQASYVEPQALCPLTKLKAIRLQVRTEQDISVDIFKPFLCFRNQKMTTIKITGLNYKYSAILSGQSLKYLMSICLKELILSNNYFRGIDARYFAVFAEKSSCLELLDLSNNPFYGVVTWALDLLRFRHLKVVKLSSIGTAEHTGRVQDNLKYRVHLQNSLEEVYCTNIKTLDTLPTLNITGGDSLKIVNASYFTFRSCKGSWYGLHNIEVLDMSGWQCLNINPRLLETKPNLVKYVARNSHLGTGFQKEKNNINIFFKNNAHLQFIDMSTNGIMYLPPDMFSFQCKKLKTLILYNNYLTEVPIYIDKFPKLSVLDISFNNFTEFSEQDMQKLGNKRNTLIKLRGNPFHCMCKNLNFLRWANTSGIKDFSSSTCLRESGAEVRMTSIIGDINEFETQCKSKAWMIFSVSFSSVILIIVVLAVLYYRYRYTLEYCFIRIRLRLKNYKPLINAVEYPYDAFISHSHNDIDFIMPMYRKLTSMGYNIAIDAKDFIPGRLIAENVVDTLEKSRKMIFVITKNFLASQWGFYELEMTRMYAFREDRQHMLIVIIKDGLQVQNMPSSLREMWSKCTCIEWPEETEMDSTDALYDTIGLALQN